MPRWQSDDDDWTPENDDDGLGESETLTLPCPSCRREIPEDAPRCPYCEVYISAEDEYPAQRRPLWIAVGLVLCLIVIFFWIF
jgi:hypothetical protein